MIFCLEVGSSIRSMRVASGRSCGLRTSIISPVGLVVDVIVDRGTRGNEVQVELALQAFPDDFHAAGPGSPRGSQAKPTEVRAPPPTTGR